MKAATPLPVKDLSDDPGASSPPTSVPPTSPVDGPRIDPAPDAARPSQAASDDVIAMPPPDPRPVVDAPAPPLREPAPSDPFNEEGMSDPSLLEEDVRAEETPAMEGPDLPVDPDPDEQGRF